MITEQMDMDCLSLWVFTRYKDMDEATVYLAQTKITGSNSSKQPQRILFSSQAI